MARRLDLGDLDAPLAALVERQQGLVRRAQLREHGMDRHHVAARVASGLWQLVAPEVVSTDNGRLDRSQLLWRAVLHAPGPAWVGHLSSLEEHGLTGWRRDQVHLLIPRFRLAPLAGVVIHQSDRVPAEAPDLAAGLPLAPPARAALDAACSLPHPTLAGGLIVATVQQRLATVAAIEVEVQAAGRVRNKVAIVAALRSAGDGAESMSEADVEPLVRRAGLPSPRRQVVIAGRRRDLAIDLPDGSVLILEIDGPHHDDPRQRWIDVQRDAELIALGYVVLRLPAYVLRADPGRVVEQLVAIRRHAEARARSVGAERGVQTAHDAHRLRGQVGGC